MHDDHPDTNRHILSLRAKSVDELRYLFRRHHISDVDPDRLDHQTLLTELSRATTSQPSLARELGKSEISTKPSFYLLLLRPKTLRIPSRDTAATIFRSAVTRFNRQLLSRSDKPTYKGFTIESIVQPEPSLVELEISWHRVYWYWEASTVARKSIYEMQYGYSFLDFSTCKAIISCHTLHERDYIIKLVQAAYPVNLSPMVLTKPVLEQIGTFKQLRRGTYFLPEPDRSLPTNVSYADENLALKKAAVSLEADPHALRKQSFYQIPLGSIVEQGVGATSDTGKLWIPREIPVATVRDYSVQLLGKVASTLDGMSRRGEVNRVLETLGIPRLPGIATIRDRQIKNEICRLFSEIVNMLHSGQSQRQYVPSTILLTKAVSQFFFHPRLIIADSKSGHQVFWSNASGTSQFLRIIKERNKLRVFAHPTGEALNLDQLVHPFTGRVIKIDNLQHSVQLVPTNELLAILTDAAHHISQQMPQLGQFELLPFYINAGALVFDIERSRGQQGLATIGLEIFPQEVNNFRKVLSANIPNKRHKSIFKRLSSLGEQCVNISDLNCQTCVSDCKFLCLRSLLARYVAHPIILAHKGIELSDMEGEISIKEDTAKLFAFAKRASGPSGLTFRNTKGSILFSQVAAQLDKKGFDVTCILTPSIVNQDLRERLRTFSGLFGKKLLLVDRPTLSKMLLDLEEQMSFDKIDMGKIYSQSKRKLKQFN